MTGKQLQCPFCDGDMPVADYRGRCESCFARVRVIVRQENGEWQSRIWHWPLYWNKEIDQMIVEVY